MFACSYHQLGVIVRLLRRKGTESEAMFGSSRLETAFMSALALEPLGDISSKSESSGKSDGGTGACGDIEEIVPGGDGNVKFC